MSERVQEDVFLHGEADRECVEWCPICRAAELFKAVSPEMSQQLREVQREGLALARSAIDLWIQHLEDEPPPARPGDAPPPEEPAEERQSPPPQSRADFRTSRSRA